MKDLFGISFDVQFSEFYKIMVNKIPFVGCWGQIAPPGSAPGPQLVNQNKYKSSRFQSRIEQKHLQREINFITVIYGVYLSPQVGLR